MDNKNTVQINWKTILIVVGIIVAIVVAFFLTKLSINTTAINKEEQIHESASSINVQMDTRNRKIKQLAQVVEKYSDYEKGIMTDFAEARKEISSGTDKASTVLNAIFFSIP